MVTTTNDVTGYRVVQHLGMVRGLTVRSCIATKQVSRFMSSNAVRKGVACSKALAESGIERHGSVSHCFHCSPPHPHGPATVVSDRRPEFGLRSTIKDPRESAIGKKLEQSN